MGDPTRMAERPSNAHSKAMQTNSEEERKAACREAGRAVAVSLIGFTLQAVSVLPTSDVSGAVSSTGVTAFKERSDATLEELTFIAAAGVWAESLASPDEQQLDIESILARFSRRALDKGRLRLGLTHLTENYRTAVLKIAQRLLGKKTINGIECGQIIFATAIDAWKESRRRMEPEHQEMPMPLTSKELIVLVQSLKVALTLEQIKEADKEVIRKMLVRIDRYSERQGAYWEK